MHSINVVRRNRRLQTCGDFHHYYSLEEPIFGREHYFGRAPHIHAAHQALDRTSRHDRALACQLPPDLVGAVDLHVGLPDALYLRHEDIIAARSGAAFVRLAQQRRVSSIPRRGDLQYLADRLDPESVAVLVDEVPQDLSRRSNSAWAKNALASFRISLARRSSLTSRFRSFTRCASLVVTPSRTPSSTSTRFTHSCSVCGTQPILGAIDSMAAHSDGYSPPVLLHHPHSPLTDFGRELVRLLHSSILSEKGASSKAGAVHF